MYLTILIYLIRKFSHIALQISYFEIIKLIYLCLYYSYMQGSGVANIGELVGYKPNFSENIGSDLKGEDLNDFSFVFEGMAGSLYSMSINRKLTRFKSKDENDYEGNNLPDYMILDSDGNLEELIEVKSGRNLGVTSRERVKDMNQSALACNVPLTFLLYSTQDNPDENNKINSNIKRRTNSNNTNILGLKDLSVSNFFVGTESYKLAMDKKYFFGSFPNMTAPEFVKNIDAIFEFVTSKDNIPYQLMFNMLDDAPGLNSRKFKDKYNIIS